MTQRVLYDPLTHFVVLGALVFGGWRVLNPAAPADDPRTIVVDRASLLTFIQYRTRSFDQEAAARRLDGWPAAVVEDLVADYVREEALYRTALEMGLDSDDYVLRQRLVQKVEYLAEGVADGLALPDDAVLEAWHRQHAGDYVLPATLTLAHVFFSAQRHGTDGARKLAARLLPALNRDAIGFEGATAFGDRFPYHVNYVDRGRDEVASHFGSGMASVLDGLQPDPQRWQGPIDSEHGSHLVLLLRRSAPVRQSFAEARERVLADWRAHAARERKDRFLSQVVSGFRILRATDVQVSGVP